MAGVVTGLLPEEECDAYRVERGSKQLRRMARLVDAPWRPSGRTTVRLNREHRAVRRAIGSLRE